MGGPASHDGVVEEGDRMKAIAIVPGLNLLYVTTATEYGTEERPQSGKDAVRD